MNYRKFGNTELLVSEIGFGSWAIGGGTVVGDTLIGWGDADDSVSIEAINRALELGINFFDTADAYGLGHSEDLLGSVLKNNREVIIATKGGNVARDGIFTVDYSKQHILEACEASLKRLKRDVIDYYQLHSARMTHLQQGECISAMQKLQQEGKIRYWGLSLTTFEPTPEADFLLDNQLGNGFQLVLNILNQHALSILQKASDKGYGIIVRMPLQFGLLTGKFDNGVIFADNDHRKRRLTPDIINFSTQILEPVWKLCDKYHITKTQLALSYILSHPGVSNVITGIRTSSQAENNTDGLLTLDPQDIELIEQMGRTDFVEIMQLIRQAG